MVSDIPIVGIISPLDWFDPSVAEFRSLCVTPVRMQQAMVPRPGLAYDELEDISGALPNVTCAARLLGNAGARAIGMTGTPFVWAGLSHRDEILDRQMRITDAAGCPVIMAGTAIAEALHGLAVRVSPLQPPTTRSHGVIRQNWH